MHRNYTVYFSDKEAAIDFLCKQDKFEPEVFKALDVPVSTLVDAIKSLELGWMGEGEKEEDMIAHGGRYMIKLEVYLLCQTLPPVFLPDGYFVEGRNTVRVSREALVEYVHKRK